MRSPNVIIDVSTVVREDNRNDWSILEDVVSAWRKDRDAKAVFMLVADRSLRRYLDPWGNEQLTRWQRERRARVEPFADRVILELATKYPHAVVITRDLYRDLRREFPWVQGSDRFFSPVLDRAISFRGNNMAPIENREISRFAEAADLKPLGMTSPEAKHELNFEWACNSTGCAWGGAPAIEADPGYRNGAVVCPECRQPARRVGARDLTRELVLCLGEDEAERIPITDGTRIVFGRGRGEVRYDVRELLDHDRATLISRDHLAVANEGGKLKVLDLGSKNGTVLIRSGAVSALTADVVQILGPNDRISLADDALAFRLSGKQRPRGRYAPDLTTPPRWAGASPSVQN